MELGLLLRINANRSALEPWGYFSIKNSLLRKEKKKKKTALTAVIYGWLTLFVQCKEVFKVRSADIKRITEYIYICVYTYFSIILLLCLVAS